MCSQVESALLPRSSFAPRVLGANLLHRLLQRRAALRAFLLSTTSRGWVSALLVGSARHSTTDTSTMAAELTEAFLSSVLITQQHVKEANANCVMGHRRQFLAELVVATIVADGAEGNTCCSVSHCAVRLSDPSQLA